MKSIVALAPPIEIVVFCTGIGRLVSAVEAVGAAPVEGDDRIRHAVKAARECGVAHKGDLIAVVSASPGKRAGATDTVRIVRV